MERILLSERYLVLLLHAAGEQADLGQPQYSAGVILGGILDLREAGCIKIRPDGRLAVSAPLSLECSGLQEIYKRIGSSSKTAAFWLEYFCCSPDSKRLRLILEEMYAALEKKGIMEVRTAKGLWGRKTKVRLCRSESEKIAGDFLKRTKASQLEEHTVFCIQMLKLAGVLKKYFPWREGQRIKAVLRQCGETQMWREMSPYVNWIRNFMYQNAVNSGAVYQA